MPRGGRGRDNPLDFQRELRGDPLVGIDLENPMTPACVDPGVPAGSFPLPRAFDEAIGKSNRDLPRAIAAIVEHDDDFIGKAETGETIGELALLVMGDDQGRQPG